MAADGKREGEGIEETSFNKEAGLGDRRKRWSHMTELIKAPVVILNGRERRFDLLPVKRQN